MTSLRVAAVQANYLLMDRAATLGDGWIATRSPARCQPCRACIAATAPGWWPIASMNSHSSIASPA